MASGDLTWSRVLAFRAARQALSERARAGSEAAVVATLAGLHAQVASSAELALWARVDGFQPGWTAAALERRELVKTWAMRGTLHYLPADELGTFVAAQAVLPPRHAKGSWLKAYGLTADEAGAMLAAIPRVLDGPPLTREELARWFGMTSPALAGRCLKALGEEAVEVTVEGAAVWALAADVDAIASAEPRGSVRLLPAFDPHVVAAPREREEVLPAARRREVYRPQGWLSPVVVVDGRIKGTWRHERRGDELEVEVVPWADPGEEVRTAVAAEAERLAGFLGGDLSLTVRR
jgi:uncharacterized protein YcaQ